MKLTKNRIVSSQIMKQQQKSFKTSCVFESYTKAYTPHTYFQSILRDVVSQNKPLYPIISTEVEQHLRRKMYAEYKSSNALSNAEYEVKLLAIVKRECKWTDVWLKQEVIGKRYVTLSDQTKQDNNHATAKPTKKDSKDPGQGIVGEDNGQQARRTKQI